MRKTTNKPLFDIVKSYDYKYIRIKSKHGGKTTRLNNIIDEQLKILLSDASTVELLTNDAYIIIKDNEVEELKRSL